MLRIGDKKTGHIKGKTEYGWVVLIEGNEVYAKSSYPFVIGQEVAATFRAMSCGSYWELSPIVIQIPDEM